jgi:hypothetical protein
MATKKERAQAAKKRDKRTKILAVVGVVALLGIGAYEIPSMLKVMNKKPPGNTTYDPGPSTTPGGLPNVAAGATPGAGAGSGGLVNSDAPPASGAGQLVSFSVFETKNPFAPQVSTAQTTDAAGPPTTANKPGADIPTGGTVTTATVTTPALPTASPAGGGVVPSSPATTPPGTTTNAATTTTTTTAAAQPTVAIKVNGVVARVATQGTFPSGAPVFRLVSWTKDSAQIAIVGGSYATGDPTLTVRVGEPLTLENQTDGKRYKLELLSTS